VEFVLTVSPIFCPRALRQNEENKSHYKNSC
jgi:hypothetical protein